MKIYSRIMAVILLVLATYFLFVSPWVLVPIAAFLFIWDNTFATLKDKS